MTDLRPLLSCVGLSVLILSSSSMAQSSASVRTYTRSSDISRSEGLFTTRQFVPAGDFREGRLLNPAPYPVNRTDDPRRAENGRLWVPRSPVGSRSIISELPYGFPGASGYGAPFGANEEVIFVRSETGLPEIAISPFETIDDSTFDVIERQIPFIDSTLTRTDLRKDQILRELREARNQWLREEGYIGIVRTHVNPAVVYGQSDAMPARPSSIEPRAIIRKREKAGVTADAGAAVETVSNGTRVRIGESPELNEGNVIRVSGRVETAEASSNE